MKAVLHRTAATLALLGSVSFATNVCFGRDQGATEPGSASEGLMLSAEQRAAIVRAIDPEKRKIAASPAFQAKIGAEAPASIALYVLPDGALAAIPNGAHYQYTVIQDQVILVDPTTMRVVDVIR